MLRFKVTSRIRVRVAMQSENSYNTTFQGYFSHTRASCYLVTLRPIGLKVLLLAYACEWSSPKFPGTQGENGYFSHTRASGRGCKQCLYPYYFGSSELSREFFTLP